MLPPRSASAQILQLAATRPRPLVRRPLGELLLAAGKLTEAQLKGMLERQRREGGKLGERLVAEGLVTDEELVATIGEQLGIPFIPEHQLRALPVPTPLLSLLPLEHAERFEAVPLTLQGKELFCAMREPQNLERLDELQFRTGYAVRGLLASEGAIRRTINRFYRGDDPTVGPDWGNLMKVSASEALPGVTPFADKHTRTRERVLEKLPSRLRAAARAGPRAAGSAPPSPAPARPPPRSLARTLLVVADDPRAAGRRRAPLLEAGRGGGWQLQRGGRARRGAGRHRGGPRRQRHNPEAPAVVARLMAVAPTMEVRVLPSLAEALGGEAGPLGRAARLHARVLDAALAALGGAGCRARRMARLARRVAHRLGAGRAEAERASAAAYAMACASRLEGKDTFARPKCEAVRALLGRDAGELASRPRRARGRPPCSSASRAALALNAATALMEALGTGSPTPDDASRALVRLREEGRVPAIALEALAAEVAELVLGDAASPTLVLAEPDPGPLRHPPGALPRRWDTGAAGGLGGARARELLAGGATALVAASRLPDGEGAALTRSLRAAAPTAELPIFLLAPPEDPGVVEAGLDAGADDVLTYPVNPDVLAAKVRRALQPRRSLTAVAG